MTKQHFIALADDIRAHNTHARNNPGIVQPFNQQQIETLANFCAQQNPRFNRDRWLDYIAGKCGPSGGKVKTAKTDTRSGCQNKVCWCHMDPHAYSFHCSGCGCYVEVDETVKA